MDFNDFDFWEICKVEGGQFYSDIITISKSDFNAWIVHNLQEIETFESFDDVRPSEELQLDLRELGYNHQFYQCHYSAKATTILKDGVRYYTGFVKRDSYDFPIITHSFNVIVDKIVDFARIEDPDYKFSDYDLSHFPNTYFGIEIPRKFIKRYQEETLENHSMRPLLIEWFIENNTV